MKKIFSLAMGLLALAGLWSCSEDTPQVPVADSDETRYLRVSIASNGPGSRAFGDNASDFLAGEGVENDVKRLDFYFYDVNKEFVQHVHLNASDIDDTATPTPGHVEKVLTSVVPITLVQGATIPCYVIVALNAVDPDSHKGKSMEDCQKDFLFVIGTNTEKESTFAMSNSVYYGDDPVKNEQNVLIMATPITQDKLKTKSEMDDLVNGSDKEALKAATITVYVERYAARIELFGTNTDKSINIKDFQTSNGVTLRFVPEGWTLNNFEKSFYFVKSFRKSDGTGAAGVTFEDYTSLNNLFLWKWNDADRYRSYWSRTPAYYFANYPVVADDILDNLKPGETYDPDKYTYGTNGGNGSADFTYNYHTFYHTYNSFNRKHHDIGKVGYHREATISQDVLRGTNVKPGEQHNPLAAIPSAIVVGHYEVYANGTKVEVNGKDADNKDITLSPTFYIYGSSAIGGEGNKVDTPTLYSDGTNPDGTPLISGTQTLLDYMLKTQQVLYRKGENNTKIYDLSDLKEEGLFAIEHPKSGVRQNMKVASRIVTLQYASSQYAEDTDKDNILYFHDPKTNKEVRLAGINERNYANQLLFASLGGASAYTNGRAFFSAPIKHFGWYRTDNAETEGKNEGNPNMDETDQSKWEWSSMRAGDFGVVRNHSYKLSVSGITGLGTGILGMDDPLLPPTDNVTYKMRYEIKIQKWAVLPMQNIDW